MMGAGNATVTMDGKCVLWSPAQCLPVATPPFIRDSAARRVQVKAGRRRTRSLSRPDGLYPAGPRQICDSRGNAGDDPQRVAALCDFCQQQPQNKISRVQ